MSGLTPIRKIEGRAVVLPIDHIDTDRIIPARFLKTLTRTGLGRHLFDDWRAGPFDVARATGRPVLVAGRNFGCGSSREHAAWALRDFGFRAVVAPSFGDIFYNNALKNGLVCVPASATLLAAIAAEPEADVVIDLAERTVGLAGGPVESFPIEPFARHCLLEGTTALAFLLRHVPEINRFEETRRWNP